MIREGIEEAIKDKLRRFYKLGKKIFLKTIPSTTFPNGKFYNGIVIDVLHNHLVLLDDVEGRIEILFILIASPEDIQISWRIE